MSHWIGKAPLYYTMGFKASGRNIFSNKIFSTFSYVFLIQLFMPTQLEMLKEVSCQVLCEKELTAKESDLFISYIKDDYIIHM